jgi:hypothetical protein
MSTLPLTFKRELVPVPEADWSRLKGEAEGIAYACEKSGMQDKSIALETGIDPAVLSKAKTAQARLNCGDLERLMDATGSEAPLYARLLRRGYDPRCLRKLESETERELRETREELARVKSEREVELRLLRELKS